MPTSCASISIPPGGRLPDVPCDRVRGPHCFDELGIDGHPKTTGPRGIHIYVRWSRAGPPMRSAPQPSPRMRARAPPARLHHAAWWKEERGDRAFVDFNQNAPHKTVFGAWAARATPDARVSTPIEWDEVKRSITITSPSPTSPPAPPPGRPVGGDVRRAQNLEPLLAMSAREMANGLMDAPWPPVYPKSSTNPRESPQPCQARRRGLNPTGQSTRPRARTSETGTRSGLSIWSYAQDSAGGRGANGGTRWRGARGRPGSGRTRPRRPVQGASAIHDMSLPAFQRLPTGLASVPPDATRSAPLLPRVVLTGREQVGLKARRPSRAGAPR